MDGAAGDAIAPAMSDRLFFTLAGLIAAAMIALALVWPAPHSEPGGSETVSDAVDAAVSGDLR